MLYELNTLHLQGFVHFKKQLYFNSVKLILGTRTHVQCARGSDQQNKVYCSKDNNLLLEFGVPSKFFTNNQDDNLIFEIGQRIADGDSIASICEDAQHAKVYARHYKAIENISQSLQQKINRQKASTKEKTSNGRYGNRK